ncbi:MAG: TylF/MycF/NovP-related O-methyltransferase [Desulfomonilaceae bacterium]|jgi:hypothetical protein
MEGMDMKLGSTSTHDIELTNKMLSIAKKRPLEEIFQAFPAYTRRQLLTRFLAYYELFKKIQDTPGWIAECGVYRGFSFFSLGKFLEIFCMGDKTRKIIGFDNFKGFTPLHPKDGPPDPKVTRHEGGTNPEDFEDEFMELLKCANNDCFAPWAERMVLVNGDARVTIPDYCNKNPGLRLSMLHIDVDIYEPVLTAFEHLYPKVLPGGIIVLDEFAHKDWPGESAALEDYFKANNLLTPKLQTLSWVGSPTTFFIKTEW